MRKRERGMGWNKSEWGIDASELTRLRSEYDINDVY